MYNINRATRILLNTYAEGVNYASRIFITSTGSLNKAFRRGYTPLFIFFLCIMKDRAPYDDITRVNTAHYADRYFQRPATETMSNIIDFHNDLMVVLIFISIFIFVMLSICLYNYATMSVAEFYIGNAPVSKMNHNSFAEVVFTVVPAIIVYTIAAPSFALLYSNND